MAPRCAVLTRRPIRHWPPWRINVSRWFTLPRVPSDLMTNPLEITVTSIVRFMRDDDVGHVMREGFPVAELYGPAPKRLDPFQSPHAKIGKVIDHLWRKDLFKSVQVTAIE